MPKGIICYLLSAICDLLFADEPKASRRVPLIPISGLDLIYCDVSHDVSSSPAKDFSCAPDQENQSVPQTDQADAKDNCPEHFVSLRAIFYFSRYAEPGSI